MRKLLVLALLFTGCAGVQQKHTTSLSEKSRSPRIMVIRTYDPVALNCNEEGLIQWDYLRGLDTGHLLTVYIVNDVGYHYSYEGIFKGLYYTTAENNFCNELPCDFLLVDDQPIPVKYVEFLISRGMCRDSGRSGD
ncbi:MAG: hypothetical protein ACREBR_04650 [bacterium]